MQIERVESQLGRGLPAALRALYATRDGHFDDGGQWWVVWPLERVVADNLTAWGGGHLPASLLAFGDDGTGNPFCVNTEPESDEVLRWSWIDGAVSESEGSFVEFQAKWIR